MVTIYTADMFATGNDADNRAAGRAVATAQLDLVGLAVRRATPRHGCDRARRAPSVTPI